MLIRVIMVIGIVFVLLYPLQAQSNVPRIATVEYEILTTDLQANSTPQSLNIKIRITRPTPLRDIHINLGSDAGKLTLLSAKKNDASLWLIQSENNSIRENILSWSYSDSNKVLALYPYAYAEPFVLDLEIQVNYTEKIASVNMLQDTVLVDVSLVEGKFTATVSGRGNLITIIK